LAWGAFIGGSLQFLVQLPTVLRMTGRVPLRIDFRDERARTVVRTWLPVVFGAGVLQISSIIDTQLASLVGPGSVASLGYAQLVAVLPVSLFGVSVAAAALPEMSRDAASRTESALRGRLSGGAVRIAYFIIPSAAVMVLFPRHLVGPLFQTGEFGAEQTALVSGIITAYGLAVPAQASVRLLTSGHYALGNTKTPVRIAILSVIVSAASAFGLMQLYGVVGIAMGAAIAAYVNATLNYRTLARRTSGILGKQQVRLVATSATCAGIAALAAYGARTLAGVEGVWSGSMVVLGVFGVVYLVLTWWLKHPVARALRR
jgi:putative peptidoglycan lipid II flippase